MLSITHQELLKFIIFFQLIILYFDSFDQFIIRFKEMSQVNPQANSTSEPTLKQYTSLSTQTIHNPVVYSESKIQEGSSQENPNDLNNSSQSSPKKPSRRLIKKKITLRPTNLLKPYEHIIPELIQKPEKSKRKATNIPKFIIKIFYKTLPTFPSQQHNERLKQFSKQLESSITRFHLVELFGLNVESMEKDQENRVNRQVLRRLLIRNFDNILSNTHIQHKRIYMLFSKKMLLRLNEPRLVGNIQI